MPKNEDQPKSAPTQHKLQLVLRMTGDEPTEVIREIEIPWHAETAKGRLPLGIVIAAKGTTPGLGKELARVMAEAVIKVGCPNALDEMLCELLDKVLQG